MADQLVYSTGGGGAKDKRGKKGGKDGKAAGYQPSAGPAKMRLETKGRGGKAVTVLFNLPFSEADANTLKKDLANQLGSGATFKNGTIELRGDQREAVERHFAAKGWKLVRAGG